jgi:hypothetical protein
VRSVVHLLSVLYCMRVTNCALQVREVLHESAVQQKRRQLRSLEAQLSSKRNENVTLALHLAGE